MAQCSLHTMTPLCKALLLCFNDTVLKSLSLSVQCPAKVSKRHMAFDFLYPNLWLLNFLLENPDKFLKVNQWIDTCLSHLVNIATLLSKIRLCQIMLPLRTLENIICHFEPLKWWEAFHLLICTSLTTSKDNCFSHIVFNYFLRIIMPNFIFYPL